MPPVEMYWKSFPSLIGYGVETSHLLDLYYKFGIEAFAQIDLDRRVHRNQTTNALGKMSLEFFKPLSIGYMHSGKIDQLPDMETFTEDLK